MRITVFAACALLVATAQASDTYKVEVTRKAQDLYEVMGQSVFIKTAYCYEYAYSEEAILILNSQPFSGSIAIGKLIFINGNTTCQVDTVLR